MDDRYTNYLLCTYEEVRVEKHYDKDNEPEWFWKRRCCKFAARGSLSSRRLNGVAVAIKNRAEHKATRSTFEQSYKAGAIFQSQ